MSRNLNLASVAKESTLIRDEFDAFSGFEWRKKSLNFVIDIVRQIKHMDDPAPSPLKKALDEGQFEAHASELFHPKSASLIYGWNDLISACMIVYHMYSNKNKMIERVEEILDTECDNEASTYKWKTVLAFLQDDAELSVDMYAIEQFFAAIEDKQARIGLVHLSALSYPPGVQTKEEKRISDARRDLKSRKHDEEF